MLSPPLVPSNAWGRPNTPTATLRSRWPSPALPALPALSEVEGSEVEGSEAEGSFTASVAFPVAEQLSSLWFPLPG